MRRLVLSLAAAAALAGSASPAAAGCAICVSGISVQTTDGHAWVQGMPIALVVSARSAGTGASFPDTATAVMMNLDGNRTKCITIPLKLVGTRDDTAVYAGLFYPYQVAAYDGKLELAGNTFDVAFSMRTLSATTPPAATPGLPAAEPEEPPAGWTLASEIGLMPFLGGALLLWIGAGVLYERRRVLRSRVASASPPEEA